MRSFLARPALLALLLASSSAAHAAIDEVATRSAPQDLRWAAGGVTQAWARAELPGTLPDETALRGIASAGLRLPLPCAETACEGLRVTGGPLLRGIPDAPTAGGRSTPLLGAAMALDLEYAFRPGLALRGGIDLGDRLGAAAPLAPGGAGLAAKARSGAVLDLPALGLDLPVRVEAMLAVVQDLGAAPEGRRPEDCLGSLDIRLAEFVPVRVTATCGKGQRGPRIGLGFRGTF